MEIKEVYTFPAAHSASTKSVVALPDGRVASGGFDGALKVWSRTTWRSDAFLNLSSTIYAMCLLKDGSLAVACGDHNVHIVSVDGQRLQRRKTFGGHESAVFSVTSFTDPAGVEIVASGSRDHTVRLHTTQGELVAVLKGHNDSVTDVCSVGPSMLATASSDKTIRVFDLATGQAVLVLTGHKYSVLSLASLSGARLASGDEGGEIRIWDLLKNGTCEAVYDTTAGASSATDAGTTASKPSGASSAWALTVLPCDFLASAGDDGRVRVWDTVAGTCVASFLSPHGSIHSLDVIKPAAGSTTASVAATAAVATAGDASSSSVGSSSASSGGGLGTLVSANFADCSVGLFSIPGSVMIPNLSAQRVLLSKRMLEVESSSPDGRRSSSGGSGDRQSGFRAESFLNALKAEGSVFGNLIGSTSASSLPSTVQGKSTAAAPAKGVAASSRAVHEDDEDEDADLRDCEHLDAPAPRPNAKGAIPPGISNGKSASSAAGSAAPPPFKVVDAAEKDIVFAFADEDSSDATAAPSAGATAADASRFSNVDPLAGLALNRDLSTATIASAVNGGADAGTVAAESLEGIEARVAAAGGICDAGTFNLLVTALKQARSDLDASQKSEKASEARVHELISVVAKMQARIDTYEKQVRDLTRIAMGSPSKP